MATLVSEQTEWVADQWENHSGYPSAVLSGIRPDKRHLDQGGYHPSVEDLRIHGNADDYSNTRPDDRNYSIRYGAAIDMSMSPADMRRCHDRVRRVWADKTDPRRQYINAINVWDGSGDAVRLDYYTGTEKPASPDHTWHAHQETRRRWLLNWTAARAIVSVLKGESKAQWLASQQPAKPEETPDMDQDELLKYPTGYARREVGHVLADLQNLRNWLISSVGTVKLGVPAPGSPLAVLLAETTQAKLRHEAILVKLNGADTGQVLAAVNTQGARILAELTARAAEDARRDKELADLYRAGQSGELDLDAVLRRLGEVIEAGTAPPSPPAGP